MRKIQISVCLVMSMLAFPAMSKEGSAKAMLEAPSMKEVKASLMLKETPKGLKLTADITGLKPGAVHGFHVHENGECKGPDFKSAGGHFNPTKHPHAGPAAEEKHAGDLGNIVANAKGEAKTEVMIPKDQNVSISSYIGKAVILHAKADDLSTQPSGDAGDRIACGIIKAE